MAPTKYERLADEELMAFVDAKQPDAFAVIYDRHGASAYSLAHRIVGHRAAAEDVVQEAFLSIWRSNARFDRARGSVRSWVLSVVRNRAIDALRRGGVGAPQLNHDDDAVLGARQSDIRTDTEVIRSETASVLRAAIDELPDDQSEVIQLSYFGGFSHSEIANMLGMPLGTVKGRMRLGLDKIRAGIAESIEPHVIEELS